MKLVEGVRDRLFRCRDLAQAHSARTQRATKERYDMKVRSREFAPGTDVLLLTPLSAKFSELYNVAKKVFWHQFSRVYPRQATGAEVVPHQHHEAIFSNI